MTAQIQNRISNYFARLYKQHATNNVSLYVKLTPRGLGYTVLLNNQPAGVDNIQNILAINGLEALALAATGKSREQACSEVEQWLTKGLTDEATEHGAQPTEMALLISQTPVAQQYHLYHLGKPQKQIDLITLINKYQNG